jgi:hypothetical protein
VLTVIFDFSGSGHYKFIKDQLSCPDAATSCYFYEDPVNWIVYQPPAETIASASAWTLKVSGWKMLYYATDIPYKVYYHHHKRCYEKGTG